MKKLFSKALSLVLTLAILATVFSFIGVTASAASDITDTITNSATKVYFLDFNNASAYQGEVIARIDADEEAGIDCTGAEIDISYNYYIKSDRHNEQNMHDEIWLRNWAVSRDTTDANVPNEDQNNQSYLREGMGSFTATYVCPTASFIYGASFQQHGGVSNAKVYIWDLKVYLDGELVDTNPLVAKNPFGDSATVDVSVVSYEEMFNAQKAWKISLKDVAAGAWYAAFSFFNTAGATVTIEFDYYFEAPTTTENQKPTAPIYVMNVAGQGVGTVEQDNVASDKSLIPGQHHWYSVKENVPSACAFAFQSAGNVAIAEAEIYLWNLNIYVTTNPGAENESTYKQVANADPSHGHMADSNASKGVTVVEGTYGEIMATRKAYVLDYAPLAAEKKADGNWLSFINRGNDTEFHISFNYKIVGAKTDNAIRVQSIGNGANLGYLTTDGQEHYYEYTGVLGISAFAIRLCLNSYDINTNVKVYIWNYLTRASDTPYNQKYLGRGNVSQPWEEITYADVVNKTEAMYVDFSTAETEATYNDNGEFTGYAQAKQQLAVYNGTKDKVEGDVVFAFDYYLANATENEVFVNNMAGIPMNDDKTGTTFLQPGRHTFTITGKKFSQFGVGGYNIAAVLCLNVAESKAKLYIWNLTCKVGDEEYAGFNKGIFDTDKNVYNEPTVSVVTYADVDNKFDANNDGATNVLDLIRAKRVALNANLMYDKTNLGYAKIDGETLVEMKKAVLAK